MAKRVVVFDDATGQQYTLPVASSPGMVVTNDATLGPTWRPGDLTDVPVTATTATLAVSTRSGVTGAGPYTAPAVAAAVGVPPQQFAIRNDGTAAIVLQVPDRSGTVRSQTILVGEDRLYRQTTTSGYSQQQTTGLDASSAKTPNTIVIRDVNGRAKIGGAVAADDITSKTYVDGAIAGPLNPSATSGTGLFANNTYIFNTTSAQTATMDPAPIQGANITVVNTAAATSTFNLTITATSGSVFAGQTASPGATTMIVRPGETVQFKWYDDGGGSPFWQVTLSAPGTGVPLSNVKRDKSGRYQAVDPVAAADVMTRGFQDSKTLAVLTANVTSSATANTETIMLSAALPANSPYMTAGRPIKIRLFGYSTSTGTLTFRARAGANGTTADTVLWTSTTTAAQAANQRASLDIEAVLTAAGASGSINAEGDGTAGTAAVGTAVAAPVSGAVATTAAWFLEVTVVCSVASGFVARMGSIVVN